MLRGFYSPALAKVAKYHYEFKLEEIGTKVNIIIFPSDAEQFDLEELNYIVTSLIESTQTPMLSHLINKLPAIEYSSNSRAFALSASELTTAKIKEKIFVAMNNLSEQGYFLENTKYDFFEAIDHIELININS
ncbi:MAG: hypothetical protein A3E87_08005 [Gammaproteobacteria bacterium RIFCSPHIGHO2_12_FULL_35_23]|nr:MAG: hypothetical protein A3E87_08005 [Gammaproteobacteria bacterium RIFCSPHIGHO2_12_FULL_35_23]